MLKQEFLDKLTEIGTCEDDTQRRSMLAGLSTEAEKLYDDNEKLTDSNKDLTAKNENLRSANMDLFLQIGNKRKPDDDSSGGAEDDHKAKTYESLFDEKGELR